MAAGASGQSFLIEVFEEGERFTLDYSGSQMLTIGRAADCDIVLATKKASRVHCEIFGEGGRYTLVDAGSSNGTYVNGERVDRQPLAIGDEIRIGPAVIQFGEKPAPVRKAPAAAKGNGASSRAGAGSKGAAATGGRGATSRDRPATERGGSERPAEAPPRTAPRGAPGLKVLNAIIPVVLLGLLAYGIWMFLYGTTEPPVTPSQEQARTTPRPDLNSSAEGISDEERIALIDRDLLTDPLDAMTAFDDVRRELASGRMGWDAIERLEELIASFPGTRSAERARRWIEALQGIRTGVTQGDQKASLNVLQGLLQEQRYGAALAVSEFLAASATDADAKLQWRGWTADVRANARSKFRRLERDLADLLAAGNGADALRALVTAQDQFAGLDFFAEELPRYVDASLVKPKEVVVVAPPIIGELRERVARSFDACRFRDMPALYYQMLSYQLPPAERARALEGLVEAFYLERMFGSFLEGATGREFEVSLSDVYQGKIIRVTDEEVEQELDVGGHAYRQTMTWPRLGPVKKYALFRSVPLGADGLLGLAYYSYRIGHEEGAHNALIRLHKRKDSKHLAEAILSQKRGMAIPEGGFVEHRDRLVTPAERDAEIALRKQRREDERAALAELKRMKKSKKLEEHIATALTLRETGNFELAHRVLVEIAGRWPDTDAAKQAQAIIDNPVLAKIPLVENGPRANRLDIVFLGDGWPIENDYQEAYTYRVSTCRHLLMNEEPYREYQSYINLDMVHLGSPDRGLDRTPGDVLKDTPLDGKVEWTVITVNQAKVQAILRQVYGEETDGQAICICNDYADVATGGGGVVSLSKAGLTPVGHEVGHALGALLDEYDYDPGTNPDRLTPKGRKGNVPTEAMPPNVMRGSNRDDVLRKAIWRNWIDAGEERWWNRSKVGVFEGANRVPFEHWRPQMDCKMRNAGSRFCVVCMEVMVKSIYRHVRPIDGFAPEAAEVDLPKKDELTLKVYPMKPETHFLEATWYIDFLGYLPPRKKAGGDDESSGRTGVRPDIPEAPEGDKPPGELYRRVYRTVEPEGRLVECCELRGKDLDPGGYRVTVVLRDTTEWVLEDPERLLQQRHEWIIRVGDE